MKLIITVLSNLKIQIQHIMNVEYVINWAIHLKINKNHNIQEKINLTWNNFYHFYYYLWYNNNSFYSQNIHCTCDCYAGFKISINANQERSISIIVLAVLRI